MDHHTTAMAGTMHTIPVKYKHTHSAWLTRKMRERRKVSKGITGRAFCAAAAPFCLGVLEFTTRAPLIP